MLQTISTHNVSVEEFTTPCPITVSTRASIGEVSNLMSLHNIRHVPVVNDNIPVGMISDRDVKLASKFPNWQGFSAGDLMSTEPFMVSFDTRLDNVAFEMSSRKIGSALVMDEVGEILGIFTSTDALNALVEVVRGEV